MTGGKRKLKGGGYRVRWGGKTRAKKTSKAKADAQLRLLRTIEHGYKPKSRRKRRKR